MRTKYLAISTLPERFRKDVATFTSFSEQQTEALIKWIDASRRAREAPEPDEFRDLANALQLRGDQLNAAITSSVFAVRSAARFDDQFADFVTDLVDELGLLDAAAGRRLLAVMNALIEHPVLVRSEEAILQRGFQVLTSVTTRCVALATYQNEYSAGDDPENYDPNLSGIHAAIELQLGIEGPLDDQEAMFVLTRRDASLLANRLRLALRQLDAFEARISTEGKAR